MLTLQAFENNSKTSSFKVEAEVLQHSASHYLIRYSITGPLASLRWPPPDLNTLRRQNLWQNTCLEAFFGDSLDTSAPYVELNASPVGNWNLYNFSSYRTGMVEASDVQVVLKRKNSPDCVQFQVEVQALGAGALPVHFFGLSVVLEFEDGEKSYWALSHGPEKPDFHNKSTWKSF